MRDSIAATEKWIAYAKEYLELDERDEFYVKNRLLEILDGTEREELSEEEADRVYAALSLSPSQMNRKFQALCGRNAKQATDWLYAYCVRNDYVKKAVLDKNPRFEAEGLVVTINKAKPEFRDPKKAKAGNSVDGGFAKCVICRENEGLASRNKRTLRTVDLTLGGENWFWQYSPYGYFHEHGIAVNCKHTPMHVDRSTFGKLMDFVDTFPHYFIGCNAPLPRIGGSVLAHDHYQGGGEILPMHKAKAAYVLKNTAYPDVTVEVVDWPGTVVRVVSEHRESITANCDLVRESWVNYNASELGIVAEDETGVHNAISPTVVKTDRGYEMSMILRSNITSKEYPDGVFHAHSEYHMIKKESIGLIEAQGLFILPGRLEEQLGKIESFIAVQQPLPPEYAEFKLVYDEVAAMVGQDRSREKVHEAMKTELGLICFRILENTAVFKDKKQTVRFLKELGFE